MTNLDNTTSNQNDSSLAQGQTKVLQAGSKGKMTVTYKITCKNGKQIKQQKLSQKIVTKPVSKVVEVGTYVAPAYVPPVVASPAPTQLSSSCDPNYSGGCVPIASDVDCGGGGGNGPAYFYGTATVVGTDIYGLDRDGDGTACE